MTGRIMVWPAVLAVRFFLDTVYEPHYARYGEFFGGRFAGFFSDEPEIGNASEHYRIGHSQSPLPWCGQLYHVNPRHILSRKPPEKMTQAGTASGMDYMNMCDAESVHKLIEAVYEPHYAHYALGTKGSGFSQKALSSMISSPPFASPTIL